MDDPRPALEKKVARFRTALVAGVVGCILAELAGAFGLALAPHRSIVDALTRCNPFLASAALGSFVIFAWSRPSRTALLRAVALGVLLEILSAAYFVITNGPPRLLLAHVGFGLGASGILFAISEFRNTRRREALATLLACCVTPLFILLSLTCLDLTIRMHPHTFDSVVYAGDSAFGPQPSFLLARLLEKTPILEPIVMLVYIQLPAAFAAVYAVEARRGSHADVLSSFLLAGIGGFLCYHLLPVVGPRYAFAGWPSLDAACVASMPAEPRNCMPSLHTTWALLLFWHARPLGARARFYTGAWLAITVFATLACGYHYLLDLVVAVPFSLMVRAITLSKPRIAVIAAAVVGSWLLVLRIDLVHQPLAIVAYAVITIASSLAQARRLRAASPTRESPLFPGIRELGIHEK